MVQQTVESYIEKIKTRFVTDPRLKQPISDRTKDLRSSLLSITPKVCPERGRLYTESWKETEGQPVVIRRAKALDKILSEMSIFIRPGELIVGNQASDVRAAPVFPEFCSQFILDELDGKPFRFEDRPGDRFEVKQEDEETLREIAEWWKGKTATEYRMSLYPDDVKTALYELLAVEILTYGEGGGSGNFIADYPKVLKKGLHRIVDEAEERLKSLEFWKPGKLEQKYFLEAVIISLKAAIKFAKRYAALARELAEKEGDPERKEELLQIAEHCERVPDNPARTLWEAMQAVWFIHLIIQIESNANSISYGRFDQYMYPFYKKDIDEGRLTPETVVELLECFCIKTTEINKLRSWAATRVLMGYPLFQQLTIGGQTIDRESAVNDLSFLLLEAVGNQKLTAPNLSVRCWDNMPEDFLMKCAECISVHRGGMPQMHNDESIIPSLLSAGVEVDDAYNYGVSGCVGIAIPGMSRRIGISAGYNLLKILEMTLNNGKDPQTGIQLLTNPDDKDLRTFESFEELMSAFKRQVEYYNRIAITGLTCTENAFLALAPTPYASGLIADCIELGKDIESGGCHYKTAATRPVGMANVGNSLAAIKKLVFEEHKLTAAQLMHAMETNFEDDSAKPTGEEIRQMLLAVPKFGNDDDCVDSLTREATDYAAKDMHSYVTDIGSQGSVQLAPVSQNVPFGELTGATPDGRKAGTPTADGISPTQGTDKKGPTAVIKSAGKLNHITCDNGTLLNQKITPTVMKDISGLRKLADLVRTYFRYKGQHIQINVVSADTLRDAQQHPDKYQDLMVRVAGYSALFTPLDPAVQNDIIARTEQTF